MRDVVRPSAARASDFCSASAIASLLLAVLALVLWLASRDAALSAHARCSLWTCSTVAIFISILPGGLTTTWFYVRGLQLVEREEARGYSTGAYNPRKLRIIDPKTGLILREATDPPLENRRDVADARERARTSRNSWSMSTPVAGVEGDGDIT